MLSLVYDGTDILYRTVRYEHEAIFSVTKCIKKADVTWWCMSLLRTVQTFKDAESSVLQFTVMGRQRKG